MFHVRQTNHKTNRLHERALGIAYNGYVPSFQDVLSIIRSQFTIKTSNLWQPKFIRPLPGVTFKGLFNLRSLYSKSKHRLEKEKIT